MTSAKEPFQELLKDIFLRRDEFENEIQKAIVAAKTIEELQKLNNTIGKFEKALAELKGEIVQRLGNSPAAIAIPKQEASQALPAATPVLLPEKKAPLLPTPSEPQASSGVPQSTRVFHNVSWQQFRKKPDIPDTQRVHISSVALTTTEEDVYNFFGVFGKVMDVKLFRNNAGTSQSGVVGFSNAETGKNLVGKKYFIGPNQVQIRQYHPREDRLQYAASTQSVKKPELTRNEPKIPDAIYGKRYQVFCGGIPLKATDADVFEALKPYGKIRDIKMSYIGKSWRHRGFAFIDYEKTESAIALIKDHYVPICDKRAECKANTRSEQSVMFMCGEGGDGGDADGFDETASFASLSLSEIPSIPTSSSAVLPDISGGSSRTGASSVSPKSAKVSSTVGESESGAEAQKNCVICKGRPRSCRFLWCGHVETCMDCGSRLKNCTREKCDQPIASVTSL